jgi:hypothetical protein
MKRIAYVLAIVAGLLLLSMATTACQEKTSSEQPTEQPAVETTDAAGAETQAGEEAASEHPSEQPDAKTADQEKSTPKSEHPTEHPG